MKKTCNGVIVVLSSFGVAFVVIAIMNQSLISRIAFAVSALVVFALAIKEWRNPF